MVATTIPLFPGIPGGPELLVILLIAVLLFGANKIPKLARSTGEAMGEFQKGREEVEQELEEMREGSTASESDSTVDEGVDADSTSSASSADSTDSESATTDEKTTETSN